MGGNKDSNKKWCEKCCSQPCICTLEAAQAHLQDNEIQALRKRIDQLENVLEGLFVCEQPLIDHAAGLYLRPEDTACGTCYQCKLKKQTLQDVR